MINASIILFSFLALVVLLLVSFGIGRVLSALAARPMDLVEDILNGLLLLVSGYAIFISGAHTIFLPIPLLVLFLVFLRKDKEKPGSSFKIYSWVLVLALLFYGAFFLLAFISWEPDIVRVRMGDGAFYARLASFLNDKGVENYRIDYVSTDLSVVPYHYFDCWAGALSGKIFGLNTHYAMMLVVYPFFTSLFVLVVFKWLRKENRAEWKTGIVALLSPLFSGVGFLYPSHWMTAEVLSNSPLGVGKVLCPAVFLVWMLFLLRKNDISRALILSSIIVLCNTTLLPAVALLAGWLLFQSFRQKRIQSVLPALLLTMISGGYFIWFYGDSGYTHFQFQYSTMEYIIRSLKMMVGGFLEISLWLPIIVIGYFLFRNYRFKMVLEIRCLLIFVFGGLLGWVVCWPIHVEYQQLYESAFVLGTSLLTALVLVNAMESFKRLVYIPILAIFLFFIVRDLRFNYKADELVKADVQKAKDFLQRNGPGNFASYQGKEAFPSYYSLLTQTYPALIWFGYLREPYQSFSLDTWELREEWKSRVNMGYAVEALDQAPFTIFTRNHPGLMGIERDKAFLKETGVHYLQVSKTARKDLAGFMINDSLILSDGWKVYHF